MIGLYLFGILMGIITAYVSKKTIFKGEAVPFVMELPNYRMPGLKNVARLLWDKAKDCLQRAFSVILITIRQHIILYSILNKSDRKAGDDMNRPSRQCLIAIMSAGLSLSVLSGCGVLILWRRSHLTQINRNGNDKVRRSQDKVNR